MIPVTRLDPEENEILEAFENGTLRQAENSAQDIERHQLIAKAMLKRDARLNIRLSSKDFRALQARALKEGIPYQMLVSSILHKFIDGQLVEKL